MGKAFIGLGSNLGNRRAQLRASLHELKRSGQVTGVSSLYESAPIGGPAQGDYLNAVVAMSTNLTPECLLRFMGALEQAAGRQRQTRWGPRTLDLDLLWYDNLCLLQADLILPHPRYGERRFVVEPWLEIWPDGIVGTTPLANCLPEVTQQPMVRVEGPEWAE